MADEGDYCTVCGGTPPDKIVIKRIIIDGKETGIDKLEWIIEEVQKLKLTNKQQITEEIMLRVARFNYIPTKKKDAYREALLEEYQRSA